MDLTKCSLLILAMWCVYHTKVPGGNLSSLNEHLRERAGGHSEVQHMARCSWLNPVIYSFIKWDHNNWHFQLQSHMEFHPISLSFFNLIFGRAMACGCSQARDWTCATAATQCHCSDNAGSLAFGATRELLSYLLNKLYYQWFDPTGSLCTESELSF